MPTVRFHREGVSLECAAGENLREVALRAGVGLYRGWHVLANCRGKGRCGSCRIELAATGSVLPAGRSPSEHRHLDRRFSDAATRLACQVCVVADAVVRTQPFRGGRRMETRSFLPRTF